MAKTTRLDIKENDPIAALRNFFGSLLATDEIGAVLVPQRLPMKNMVMPTLVSTPEQLEGMDPISPAFPMNAAKIVSRLTRKKIGRKIAALLRPCEIRAFVELVKLKQGRTDELVIVGMDCLGACKNTDYFKYAGEDVAASSLEFFKAARDGKATAPAGIDLAPACRSCEQPIPLGADIQIGIYGLDADDHLLLQASTAAGETLLDALSLAEAREPAGRRAAIDALVARRIENRDKMFADTREATNSLEKLTTYLANCVNCYNCRVACPVCYCKECVFVTDVFNHEPAQYLRWAERKGAIKMPTDTVFYHITRIAHMSTACVGCGQCSNACPNDIPVMELFRLLAAGTQKGFDYEAGRSIEERPPLSVFREDEFRDVVGIS